MSNDIEREQFTQWKIDNGLFGWPRKPYNIQKLVDTAYEMAKAARAQGDAEPVAAYRYRVVGDPQGWGYSSTPFFGPESGPGPREEHQELTIDQLLSELNDIHPPAPTGGTVPEGWKAWRDEDGYIRIDSPRDAHVCWKRDENLADSHPLNMLADLGEAMLAAAPEAQGQPRGGEWEVIDSAPQDGTVVHLGWWETWPKLQWKEEIGQAGNMDTARPGCGTAHGLATHWKPLGPARFRPQPPKDNMQEGES